MRKISPSDLRKLGERKQTELPVQDESGQLKIKPVQYLPKQEAASNSEFAKGVLFLIESQGASYSNVDIWAFKQACLRNSVTCQELIDAYWLAYQDPFVGKEGIHFRHLWKHIEVMRKGESRRTYTYEEVLQQIHKYNISQDCFTMIDEIDERTGHKKWVKK